MAIPPPARQLDDGPVPPGTAPVVCSSTTARVVTASQVDHAVVQLRERRGQSAAEQLQAVLRALDLTVVPDPSIPRPR